MEEHPAVAVTCCRLWLTVGQAMFGSRSRSLVLWKLLCQFGIWWSIGSPSIAEVDELHPNVSLVREDGDEMAIDEQILTLLVSG